jgi:ParB family chromosome partitioning protein
MHDLIQPVTVSKLANGLFRLIAGERRFRAARMAGLRDIPAFVRQANDQQLLEFALLENLQREDLNAMEIALSYRRMMDDLNYTQEQVAERMGKERSTVANYIRLLKLPPDIQIALRSNELSMGHARALINVDTVDKQLHIFQVIKNKALSVRQTEEIVRRMYKGQSAVKDSVKHSLPGYFKKIEDNLASHFSTRVKLHHAQNGKGNISIEYYSVQELNKILSQLGVPVN